MLKKKEQDYPISENENKCPLISKGELENFSKIDFSEREE